MSFDLVGIGDDIVSKQVRCPICEKHTFEDEGDFAICPVCSWENDNVQYHDPDYDGGANEMSQNEYRKNWLAGKPVR